MAKYADPLLDLMDATSKCVRWRLFREACVPYEGNYVKDLACLGRDLAATVIVDNSPHSYVFQPENAVPISTFIDDASDQELLEVLPQLLKVEGAADVRAVLGPQNVAGYAGPPFDAGAGAGAGDGGGAAEGRQMQQQQQQAQQQQQQMQQMQQMQLQQMQQVQQQQFQQQQQQQQAALAVAAAAAAAAAACGGGCDAAAGCACGGDGGGGGGGAAVVPAAAVAAAAAARAPALAPLGVRC